MTTRNNKMSRTLIISPADSESCNGLLEDMFKFRHVVFKERMGWEVTSENGMERDRYDDMNPVYILSICDEGFLQGVWRLLPTTQPYMLEHDFPVLLGDEEAPKHKKTWELSRFAVSPYDHNNMKNVDLNLITRQMLQAAFKFAEKNDIDRYVTVTSVSLERLMKKGGIPITRFSPPVKIGKVRSVACKIDINLETGTAINNMNGVGQKKIMTNHQLM